MMRRLSLRVVAGRACWLVLALTIPTADPARAVAGALPLEGQELRLTLEPDEELVFSAPVEAGDYLHLEVDQISSNVALELFAGDQLAWQTNQRPWTAQSEWAFFLADGPAEVRVVIRSLSPVAGEAELQVVARRAATTTDRKRYAAEKLFDDSRTRRARVAATEQLSDWARESARLFGELGLAARQSLALKRVATLLILQGRALDALEPLARAIEIARSSGDRFVECFVRLTWAEAVYARSVDEALAEERFIAANFTEPESRACTLKNARVMIYDLSERGAYREAEQVFEQAMAVASELHAEREITELLMNVGSVYKLQGDMVSALDAYSRAHDRYEAEGREGLRLAALDNLASVFHSLGDYERAMELRQVVMAASAEHAEASDQTVTAFSLASTAFELGRYEDAAAAWQESLRLATEFRLAREQALSHLGLAQLALAQSDFGSALASAGHAMEINQQAGFLTTWARILMGRAEDGLGDRASAADHFATAARDAALRGDWAPELAARGQLALLHWRSGDSAAARTEVHRALEIVESVRSRIPTDSLRSHHGARHRELFDLAIELELAEHGASSQSIESAFLLAERARAQSLRAFLDSARKESRARIDADLLDREEALFFDLQEQTARLTALRTAPEESPSQREELRATRRALAAAGAQLLALAAERQVRHPRQGRLLDPTPADLGDIRRVLGDAVLLTYHVSPQKTWLFVLDRERLTVHTLAGSDTLRPQVEALRRAQSRPSRFLSSYSEPAHELWKQLLLPVAERIGEAKLVISADDVLLGVPFEGLLEQPAGRGASFGDLDYVLLSRAISYTPSAQLLVTLARESPKPQTPRRAELVAFADPLGQQQNQATPVRRPSESPKSTTAGAKLGLRSSVSRDQFGPLPNARREVQQIERLFGRRRAHTLYGRSASEARVHSAETAAARILHFASHAFVDPEFTDQSALVLADGAGHDGLLQLREVLRLRLDAELVVLSGCSTGAGEQVAGEGVISLARAFFFAGASSLVASLWEVSDRATADLFTDFYQRILAGEEAASSLRQAKHKVLAEARTAHPFYWAAFQLQGLGPASTAEGKPPISLR